MENTIYRLNMSDDYALEFYMCGTNELNPYRETREVGVYVLKGELQVDAGLNELELESLIEYLRMAQRHIQIFNKNSKPKELTDKE